MRVYEDDAAKKYLKQHSYLVKPYKKVRAYIEQKSFETVKLKKRKPKSENTYQFRITKKYRGIGYFYDKESFVVTYISDHQ